MYLQDSFLTLSLGQQIGLCLISLSLAAMVIYGNIRLTHGRIFAARIICALGVFVIFVWISPQVYYFYYLMIFDGMPFQNVIKTTPSVSDIIQLLSFQAKPALSEHAQGILGWVLVLIAVFKNKI